MNIGRVNVVGDGVFGTFLKEEFAKIGVIQDPLSYFVILAVPFSAYAEVAGNHSGKHLINVCSIQEESTKICREHSDNVTGIHPMFGPRTTDPTERNCVMTYQSFPSDQVTELFEGIGCKIITRLPVTNEKISGKMHDIIMAKTHVKVVMLSNQILKAVKGTETIPDELLPTSFKRMRAMAQQFLDMPRGTKESILSNPYDGDSFTMDIKVEAVNKPALDALKRPISIGDKVLADIYPTFLELEECTVTEICGDTLTLQYYNLRDRLQTDKKLSSKVIKLV